MNRKETSSLAHKWGLNIQETKIKLQKNKGVVKNAIKHFLRIRKSLIQIYNRLISRETHIEITEISRDDRTFEMYVLL